MNEAKMLCEGNLIKGTVFQWVITQILTHRHDTYCYHLVWRTPPEDIIISAAHHGYMSINPLTNHRQKTPRNSFSQHWINQSGGAVWTATGTLVTASDTFNNAICQNVHKSWLRNRCQKRMPSWDYSSPFEELLRGLALLMAFITLVPK